MTGRAWYQAEQRHLDTSDPDDREIVRRHRPAFSIIHGLTIDDVAGQFPAGALVPLVRHGQGNVYLVPPASLELYCEVTGRDAAWTPGSARPRANR